MRDKERILQILPGTRESIAGNPAEMRWCWKACGATAGSFVCTRAVSPTQN